MPPKFSSFDLWESKADLIAVTTNGTIKQGGLVMGKGAAGEANDRASDLGLDLPRSVAFGLRGDILGDSILYGFYPFHAPRFNYWLGLFQTKLDYRQPSTLALIGYSVMRLKFFLEYTKQHTGYTVALNFPGIGAGGLDVASVFPLLLDLPGSVTIHFLPNIIHPGEVASLIRRYIHPRNVRRYLLTDHTEGVGE